MGSGASSKSKTVDISAEKPTVSPTANSSSEEVVAVKRRVVELLLPGLRQLPSTLGCSQEDSATVDEEVARLERVLGVPGGQVSELFHAANISGDNGINENDFNKLKTALKSTTDEAGDIDFKRFDKDGDGKIDASEFEGMAKDLGNFSGVREFAKHMNKIAFEISSATLETDLEKMKKEIKCRLLELAGEEEELELLANIVGGEETLATRVKALQEDIRSRRSELEAEDPDELKTSISQLREDKHAMRELKKTTTTKLAQLKEQPLKKKLESLEESVKQCRDEVVATRLEEAVDTAAESLYGKGFSLRQLLKFVDEKCHTQHKIGPRTTTAEVVFNLIIPETAEQKCCYSDILPGGPKRAETLMSHWWGNTFLHLVKAICQHASGKTELFSHMYTDEELDKTFWLCIFGVNQHHAICHRVPGNCQCGAPKHCVGVTCQMNKFARVMKRIPNHALAMDLELTTLKRVWVLSELDEAMNGEVVKSTKFCGVVGERMRDEPKVPSVRDAEASYPEDKDLIVGAIESRPDGVEKFDKEMTTKVGDEIASLRCFWLVAQGGAGLEAEVEKRPFLLEKQSSQGRGESLLHMAVRYGYVELASMLLNHGADVNKPSIMNWTPLHYAGVCFNPERAVTLTAMLLDAQANPNAENCFGRTPLEEAICTNPDFEEEVQDLLAERTDREPTQELLESLENPFDVEGGFTPNPVDARLFSHWCLRMDSWTRPDLSMGIIQPINGEIQVMSAWVKPMEFGTRSGEEVDPDSAEEVVLAACRLAGYIRYRWPLWDFSSIVFKYTTPKVPQHYRVDLNAMTLAQIGTDEMQFVKEQIESDFTVISHVPCSIRFLYP